MVTYYYYEHNLLDKQLRLLLKKHGRSVFAEPVLLIPGASPWLRKQEHCFQAELYLRRRKECGGFALPAFLPATKKGGLSPHPHLRHRGVPAAALCSEPQLVGCQESDVLAGAPALGPVQAAAPAPGTPAGVTDFHREVPAPPDPAGRDLPPHRLFGPVSTAELPPLAQPGQPPAQAPRFDTTQQLLQHDSPLLFGVSGPQLTVPAGQGRRRVRAGREGYRSGALLAPGGYVHAFTLDRLAAAW